MLYTKGIALLRTLEGHTHYVYSVAVAGDHTIVSGSYDRTVRVWRLSDGELLRTLKGHTDDVLSVAVVGDHTIVSGSGDKTVRVWRLSDGELQRTLKGHTNLVVSVAVVGDHTIVSGSYDRTVRVWRLSDGELLRTLKGHTNDVLSVAVVGDHTIVSGSSDKTVRVWGQPPTADEGTAGGSSSTDPPATHASSSSSSAAPAPPSLQHNDSVEITGSRTVEERNAEGIKNAISLDDGGGGGSGGDGQQSGVKAESGGSGGSSSTDPEGVAGLSSLLTGCNLQDKLAEAAKWCQEQGVDSVAQLKELPEWADKLISSLDGLPPFKAALLKKRIVEWSESGADAGSKGKKRARG